MSIPLIQNLLLEEKLDGWLFYDFEKSNHFMWDVLNIPPKTHITRRVYYWIPAKGEPIKIVHKIEEHVLSHLPGKLLTYGKREELEKLLTRFKGKIAMEYSFQIPYVSKVDGGTIDYLRSLGIEIISSATLLQKFTSVLDDEQIESHRKAAAILDQIVRDAFEFIRGRIIERSTPHEGDVVDFILNRFSDFGCVTNHAPIVAKGANSANPHYCPEKRGDPILRQDFVLIDLWCKLRGERSVYADITRVAVGEVATEQMKRAFSVVREAQKKAVEYVEKHKNVRGCDVDTHTRNFLESQGYAEFVYHRTGHNIYTEVHGPGANLDSFETFDQRILLPNSCYSVEPSVYFPGEFGLRLEHDLLITDRVEVTGGVQNELQILF